MTFFNGFQPENIIKIIIRNIGFQPLIAVSRNFRVLALDYTDPDGKRHYKSFTASTKKEARMLADALPGRFRQHTP